MERKEQMSKRVIKLLIAFTLITLVAAGCRESNGDDEITASNVEIGVEVETEAESLSVGEATLVVTVTNEDGDPVTDASIEVRGDMDHAGMVPVIREDITDNEDGVYRIPFEWTMGGDWIVVVEVTLPDETIAAQEFNFVITGDGDMDMDDMDMGDMDMGDMDMDMTEEAGMGDMDMDMTEEAGMGDMDMTEEADMDDMDMSDMDMTEEADD